jgi:hypothetical protein
VIEAELYYDGSTPVSYFDAEGIVPTTATLDLNKADGTLVAACVVTKPTFTATVAAGSTALALILSTVATLVRGMPLVVTSDGVKYVVEVARVDGTTVHLAAALPLIPDTGATVAGLRMTATVTAPGSALVGAGLRMVWTYSDATQTRRQGVAASVVRWPWTPPVSSAGVRQVMVSTFGETRTETWCQQIADRANDKIRAAIIQTGRRPYLYISSGAFVEAADKAIRYTLAEDGHCLGGQAYDAQRETRFAFADALEAMLTGAAGYDADADGGLSASERRPMFFSIPNVR